MSPNENWVDKLIGVVSDPPAPEPAVTFLIDYHSPPTNPLAGFLEASAKLLDSVGGENIPAEDCRVQVLIG